MRWRINEFIFCERLQSLSSSDQSSQQTQQLEPMVVELLAYFCRHHDEIVSRDQLIEQVWLGRVITDNAVSKVITKLRKTFNDDPRKPRFIATFPKKGYKFIAEVLPVDDSKTVSTKFVPTEMDINLKLSNSPAQKDDILAVKTNKSTVIQVILVAIVIISGILFGLPLLQKSQPINPTFQLVKALTREPGRESEPQVSPNGKYLAYVEIRDKKMHQWIKSLSDETSIEVSHGKHSSVWVASVSWNSDGSQIVYLVTTPNSCRYYIRDFKEMSIGEPQLLHNCPAGSYGKIAFTHDDNLLIYTENSGRNTPFVLFEMNLASGAKRKVNQPEIFLGGNSQFDLHPTENKLLISSPDKQIWEGFYSLDLNTDELVLLFKQDAYICCGIWDHTGERVVLMGEHPAFQLVSFDLKGENRQIVYTGSEQVREPERHSNGKDYMFPVVQINQNVMFYDFKSRISNSIANTSVDDRLARFNHQADKVAYISLSSGSEEVWLSDLKGKQRRKLTQFNDSRHYIELIWSDKGEYLLGLALNEIHLINIQTGQSELLKIPQVEIRGVSWKNDHVISYSVESKGGWSVNYYDIKTHHLYQEKQKWSYIQYAYDSVDTLWLDENGRLFSGDNQELVSDSEIQGVELLNGRTFNLKKLGSRWVWQNRVAGKYRLMQKDNINQKAKVLLLSDSDQFDLSTKGILYHTLESLNADIYQTVSN